MRLRTNSNQGVPNQEFAVTDPSGQIMDALNGAGIGGSDLQVYLIQGLSNRPADKLTTDVNNVLVGEYAFANIPVATTNTDASLKSLFKIVAVKGVISALKPK